MSRKKVPTDEELSDVTVEARHKKNRREAEGSEVVKYKHRRDEVLSDVKVDGVKRKPRREPDPGEVKTHRHKERRDDELGPVKHKRREAGPDNLNVETGKHKQRRNTYSAVDSFPYDESRRGIAKISSRSNDYAYDNKAYVGSLHNVNQVRNDRNIRILEPPTSVYREQYWACSKWSFAKKVLAIAAGVALGAGIGLAVILVVTGKDAEDVIGGIFMATAPD